MNELDGIGSLQKKRGFGACAPNPHFCNIYFELCSFLLGTMKDEEGRQTIRLPWKAFVVQLRSESASASGFQH